MTRDLVLCARDGSVAEVTLNRPEVMNALSFDLRTELIATFRNLANDRSCEIVILTGAGRAFTAGLDHFVLFCQHVYAEENASW